MEMSPLLRLWLLSPVVSGLTRLPADVWRPRAAAHAVRVHRLLKPGFVAASARPAKAQRRWANAVRAPPHPDLEAPGMLALDHRHAVYNFLLEYYHVKGQKGPRALARWSPPLGGKAPAR